MAKLIYTAITSLDGYVADQQGAFDWSAPDEQVHAFVNELDRPIGTYLLGRRMYDVLVAWETMPVDGEPDVISDFASLWRDKDKIVYSSTLQGARSARTRIERTFDPDAVLQMKETYERDLAVAGPTLASQALGAALVDEVHLFVNPVVVGGGTSALPGGIRLPLDLLDERRFGSGVVYLRYRLGP